MSKRKVSFVVLLAITLTIVSIQNVLAYVGPNAGISYNVNTAPYSATCSTTVDQSAAINSAITDASGNNGYYTNVTFNPCPSGSFYALSSSIIWKDHVALKLNGASFKWIGAANGNMLTNGSAHSGFSGIEAGSFDCGTISGVNAIYLDTFGDSYIHDVKITNCNIALNYTSDVSGRNLVAMDTRDVTATYTNLFLRMAGTGGSGGVVTNNYFYNIYCWKCHQGFIKSELWADNNYFFGGWGEQDTAGAFGFSVGAGCTSGIGCDASSNYFVSMAAEFDATPNSTCIILGQFSNDNTWKNLWCPEGVSSNPGCTTSSDVFLTDQGAVSYSIEQADICAHRVLTKGHQNPGSILPAGLAVVLTNQTGISAETALSGLGITIQQIDQPVKIMISWSVIISSTSGAGNLAVVKLVDLGLGVAQTYQYINVANTGQTMTGFVVLTPSSGLHSYHLSLTKASGAGSLSSLASSAYPATLVAVTADTAT